MYIRRAFNKFFHGGKQVVEICQYDPILLSNNKNYELVISKQEKERERREKAKRPEKRRVSRRLPNIQIKTNEITAGKTFRTNWRLARSYVVIQGQSLNGKTSSDSKLMSISMSIHPMSRSKVKSSENCSVLIQF